MPSPFPGMDPYLEAPDLWPDVHSRLINAISEVLVRQLRPRYFAQLEERRYVADSGDPASRLIVPDIRIRETGLDHPTLAPSQSGATALLDEPGVEVLFDWEMTVRETYIEIHDLQRNRVVTIIELLSPANKVVGSAGCNAYTDKREQAIAAGVNVVEIDLLRVARSPLLDQHSDHDYLVVVSEPRDGQKPRRRIWPIALRDRLKNVPVPLRPEDGFAVLPLQDALDLAYDRAGYDLRVDYRREPTPRLTALQDAWVQSWLVERGVRPKP